MKATELRIGNYIETYLGVQKVTTKEIVLMRLDSDYVTPNPIPLTEEWLVKFGFELKPSDEWLLVVDSELIICLDKDDYSVSIISDLDSFTIGSYAAINLRCKSVHQLQNLYFALTNKELTL